MTDPMLLAMLKTCRHAIDAAIMLVEERVDEDAEYECPCPESEIEVHPDSTMAKSWRYCKVCGKEHPLDPDARKGGDSE